MAQYVLTLIDTAGIQDYIFGSNHLAQNIGASERVTQATGDWVFETLDALKRESRWEHNGVWDDGEKAWTFDRRGIAGGLDAEVMYTGGGNAVVLFSQRDRQDTFVRRLTFRALRDAPGLRLIVGSANVNWDDPRAVKSALTGLRRATGERSAPRPLSTPLLGLGVTAACDFTALPVYREHTEPSGPPRPISRVVHGKLGPDDACVRAANDRLRRELRDSHLKDSDLFVRDFDDFGAHGEFSYIAVIHADGNGMGERFKSITGADNADYVRNLRAFSESIKRVARAALCATVDQLLNTRRPGERKDSFGVRGDVEAPRGYLPFRPIVFGGDDVTFVADGRLGLTLAAAYLQALLEKDDAGNFKLRLTDEKKHPLFSRAGVAVVKAHYPFARAYRLAEDLAQSAKSALTDREHPAEAVMDWHFSTSGAVLELDAIRAREYTARDGRGSLLMRPIRVGPEPVNDWRSWPVLRFLVDEFRWSDDWHGRRNKVKALRDALRAGPDAVRQFLLNYLPPERGPAARRLPLLAGHETLAETGWDDGRCGYFDAIEAADFFADLKGRGA